MRKNIEVYQLVMSVLVVIGTIVSVWINVNSRLAILETKQNDDDSFRTEIRTSLKDIQDGQTQIRIELENKKNRN